MGARDVSGPIEKPPYIAAYQRRAWFSARSKLFEDRGSFLSFRPFPSLSAMRKINMIARRQPTSATNAGCVFGSFAPISGRPRDRPHAGAYRDPATSNSGPLFSYCCEPFCIPKKAKSFPIRQIQALFSKHRDGGPPQNRPFGINNFRTLFLSQLQTLQLGFVRAQFRSVSVAALLSRQRSPRCADSL